MQGSAQIIHLMDTQNSSSSTLDLDVLKGLSQKPKSIPSKYLYDKKGSELFENITEQKEYYPTNCEMEILTRRKQDIRRVIEGFPFRLIELGVGDARKTKILLHHFLEYQLEFEYVLVDFCEEVVKKTVLSLENEFPLPITGLIGDYSSALSWVKEQKNLKNILFFLGASIGNFDSRETTDFLHELWNALNDGDYVFMGFDLKKDITVLQKAYNDPAGVTSAFNLNLLKRLNRELESDFDLNHFKHHGFYNPALGRMESWLISTIAQTVTVNQLKTSFQFDAWEGIHTENSYKFSLQEIALMAKETGFECQQELIDTKGYFVDVIWKVKKNG